MINFMAGKYITDSNEINEDQVRAELNNILSTMKEYKKLGMAPPMELISKAFALYALCPYGEFLEKLEEITKLAF